MHRNPIYHLLRPLATEKKVILWFILAHAVLVGMMTLTFPEINSKAGTATFDLRPLGYSVTEAREILEKLDLETVQIYLFPQLFLFDLLYPALLALFLSTFMIWLAGPVKGWNASLVRVGIYLPFMAMAFDYSENLLIARMITDPDHASTGLIKAASVFTLLKGISTSASWWFIVMLGGSRLKSHFSKKPVKAV